MIVISNTSPILNLAAIGCLNLLEQIFGQVFIPEQVSRELTMNRDYFPSFQIQDFPWIRYVAVADHPFVSMLKMELHDGEAEAIALEIEKQSDLLLIDEKIGRNAATRLGIRNTGLLGLLVDAKRRGFISEVKPIIDSLITKAGFWVGSSLYSHVLNTAGE